MLRKKRDELRKKLEELNLREDELKSREDEIAQAIEEVETEEEQETVEEAVTKFEEEKAELLTEKQDLEAELKKVDDELEEIEERAEETKESETREVKPEQEQRTLENDKGGYRDSMKVNKYETREQMLRRLEQPEVREFYEKIKNIFQERAEITGGELLIPESVMTSIQHRIGDYGVLINEVDVQTIKGKGRIILNAGAPTLAWTEMCADLQESTMGSLKAVEFDGYKLGGYIFLCNAQIEDAIIDLANFVEAEFAKAIAKYKDEAIMNGEGAASKQPEGILTKVTAVTDVEGIPEMLGLIGELDHDDQDYHVENVIVVMNRATYYSKILAETFGKNADAKMVYDGINRVLPDGTKVVISKTVPADEFVIGDFKNGYKWVDRKEASFDVNDRLKWIEEQTGFKVSGRHDGKVVHESFFKRGKFVTTPGA